MVKPTLGKNKKLIDAQTPQEVLQLGQQKCNFLFWFKSHRKETKKKKSLNTRPYRTASSRFVQLPSQLHAYSYQHTANCYAFLHGEPCS